MKAKGISLVSVRLFTELCSNLLWLLINVGKLSLKQNNAYNVWLTKLMMFLKHTIGYSFVYVYKINVPFNQIEY